MLLGVSQGLFVGCRSASVDRAHRYVCVYMYVHYMRMLQHSTLPYALTAPPANAGPAARSFPYRSALLCSADPMDRGSQLVGHADSPIEDKRSPLTPRSTLPAFCPVGA